MSVTLVRAALGWRVSRVAFAACYAAFVAILAHPGTARAEGCVVRGAAVTLQWVVVRPAGDSPLHLSVYGLPATARILPTPGAPASLTFAGTLAGALRFVGAAKNIWYELAKPARTHHGIVHLSPGARLARAHAEGTDVVGRIVWSADDVLEGEDKDPDAWITPVRVPCASLRLASDGDAQAEEAEAAAAAAELAALEAGNGGDGDARGGDAHARDADDDGDAAGAGDEDDAKRSPGDGTWWETRRTSDRLVLHAAPREASPSATLRTINDPDANHWAVERVAEQGSWMKVTAAGWGARVIGWIRRDELRPLDSQPGVGGGCYGDHGSGLGGHGWGGKPPKIAYKGPAEIAVGTTVYAGRGGDGAWAKVAKRDATFEVVVYEGNEWVEVTGLPGVGGAEIMAGRAYVRVGAVRWGGR